jgi:membrane dipeptidase
MHLEVRDHRADPGGWARELGVSEDACTLLLESDFIDLHCDLEVPVRVWGYDPTERHSGWRKPPLFMGHTDYPRLLEAGFTGVVCDIATNIFRRASKRQEVTLENLERLKRRIESFPEELALVRDRSEYDRARAEGKMAMWVALQGGNALVDDPTVLDGSVGGLAHRITLVHLTNSVLGGSNSPGRPDRGLSARGREFVRRCNANRILVDLAHAGKKTFWDALEVHDDALPPIVSHTGVEAVYRHWRNIDDDQIRAIADRGGVVGIIYASNFLEKHLLHGTRAAIVDHLEHIVDLVGDDYAAIGTDYDGMIIPPKDLPDVTDHPLLVQDMLDRNWSPKRIRKVLGENYLRVVAIARP